jgi:hypothetical protein
MIIHGQLPSELDDIVSDFHDTFSSDERGTLLSDIRAFSRPLSPYPPRGLALSINLKPSTYKLLCDWGNEKDMAIDSSRMALEHKSLVIRGVTFEPQAAESGLYLSQSHVAFGRGVPHNWIAGKIEMIFSHSNDTFLLVKPFQGLKDDDIVHDYYRRFPIVGGRIYYQATDSAIIIRWREIISHIAFVPSVSHSIKEKHFLALPLDRVRPCLPSVHR